MRKYLIVVIMLGFLTSCFHQPEDSSDCESEVIAVNYNDSSKGRIVYLHCADSIYVFDSNGKLLRKVSTGKK